MPSDPDNMPLDPRDKPLAEHGRALVVQASAETFAPLGLRERIETDRARAAKGGGRRRRWALVAPVAAVAAAVVAVVIAGAGRAGQRARDAALAAGPTWRRRPSIHPTTSSCASRSTA